MGIAPCHCEERSDAAISIVVPTGPRLLRFARNDNENRGDERSSRCHSIALCSDIAPMHAGDCFAPLVMTVGRRANQHWSQKTDLPLAGCDRPGPPGSGRISLTTSTPLCSCFVHVRRPKPPAPTPEPDPPRAAADMPSRLGRVLNLVRKLIDYGKQLAATVQQRAATPGFAFLVRPFGTADIAVILARITRGLRRAAMLEAGSANAPSAAGTSRFRPSACPPCACQAPHGKPRRRTSNPPTLPRTHASPASPPRKRSPRRCVAARSAPSSSIYAAISASRPAASIGRTGTKSITPSWCMAAAPSASSTTWRSGYGPP